MSAQCKGSTTFFNVMQRCEEDAYDDCGYCAVHVLLMARQQLEAALKAMRDSDDLANAGFYDDAIDVISTALKEQDNG